MRTRPSVSLGLWTLACIVLVLGVMWRQPTGAAEEELPPTQPTEVADLMHAKLSSSQLILMGLINRDMNTVHSAGEELVALAKSAAWMDATDDPVYSHFNAEFQRLSERIVRMAQNGNPDGAAYAYQGLTTTCITCHEHVRDVTRLTREVDE
jgi:hypothetical protein